ncbi:MAG TPA: tripartite tricarboxylate transporter substrate binding protein, partial [Burkholderiales bacterium]|nr:tripartite tricarboxylate transporter substrate binding protein [Burkholderiales bacterium]
MGCVIERHGALVFAVAAAVWTCPVASWSQSFPSKPVRYVVPFGAGASPDIVGRLLAERLSRMWGQQVVVDNRVGAAGVVGTSFVAKSPPDGYTLLQCNIASSAIAVSLYEKLPYDQLRDIAPVTRIGMTPNIVFVHPSVPIQTIKGFIAYARANPGKLSYASGLAGTSPHLSMELFKSMAKIDVVHIPYKIGAQGVSDNIAGQVPVGISNFPASVSPVKAGRLRPLAVTSAKRVSQAPSIPTIQEAGIPGYEVNSWYGVCAPAGTPAALLDKLHTDVNAALRSPELQARLDELVMGGPQTSREEFEQFIRSEIALWAKVIKDAGIPQQ